jgi:hypothetical protein
MSWRRLNPGELDHEALWLGVSLGAAALGAAWIGFSLPRPQCPLHAVTGIPCPGCGTTRMLEALFAGEWSAAFLLNPLACTALAAVAVFDLYALIVLLGRRPRWRPTGALPLSIRTGAVTALLLNWFWLMWRQGG